MSDDRTHFVYRVWDEFGLLLYVGCTGSPTKRWLTHRSDKAPWFEFAETRRMEGPYPKRRAFKREREVIEAELPYFNALNAHTGEATRNRAAYDRELRAVRATNPEWFVFDLLAENPIKPELSAAMDEIHAAIDHDYPVRDAAWRRANYLGVRRQHVLRSA